MPDAKFDFTLIHGLRVKGWTWAKIAEEHYPDSPPKNVKDCYHQHNKRRTTSPRGTPPRGEMPIEGAPTVKQDGDTASSIIYLKRLPKKLDEHIAEFGMDLDVWEATKVRTGNWNGWAVIDNLPTVSDLFTIRVDWQRRAGMQTAKSVIESIVERKLGKQRAPSYSPPRAPGVLALNIPDLHLGKLCWPRETGGDYDLGIACRTFAESVRALADQHALAKQATGTVILPIGNDFLNSDGPGWGGKGAFTHNGTAQDEDGRWQKSFELGLFMVIDEVRQLLKTFPKAIIRVPIIPGNHDETRIFYLGVALSVEFRSEKRVRIDNEPTSRKFFDGLDGDGPDVPVCIMFTHGHREKLQAYPALLAHRFDLRKYRSKEVYRGHLHSQRGVSFDLYQEVDQLLCRQFPSLSPADSWHAQQGYILSQRCAQSIYYRPDGHVGGIGHHYPTI